MLSVADPVKVVADVCQVFSSVSTRSTLQLAVTGILLYTPTVAELILARLRLRGVRALRATVRRLLNDAARAHAMSCNVDLYMSTA